jgi:hypothetical protein
MLYSQYFMLVRSVDLLCNAVKLGVMQRVLQK